MKKMTVLVSLLVLLAFGGISAYAADTAPAIVIKETECGVPDADGGTFLTNNSHSVVSNDKNGNTKLTCHGQVTDPDTYPEKTMHLDFSNTGIPCGTLLGITTDWKAVVTPSGNVKLTCHINPNPTP